jgi:hypothetical protein
MRTVEFVLEILSLILCQTVWHGQRASDNLIINVLTLYPKWRLDSHSYVWKELLVSGVLESNLAPDFVHDLH